MDSNGKHIKEDRIEKEKKGQKVWSPNLIVAIGKIEHCTVKQCPEKIMFNVGLNDFDYDDLGSIMANFKFVITATKEKMPNAEIYMNSILK